MTDAPSTPEFDTPERSERLQLVAHLLRNADAVPVVRGAEGAGKSRFLQRLKHQLAPDGPVALIDGGAPDIAATVCEALRADPADWPELPGQPTVLVDDADRLSPPAAADLLALRASGGRLVLAGANRPAGPWTDVDLQVVDLPAFTQDQAREFLAAAGRGDAALWDDARFDTFYVRSDGLPGALLDGADHPPQPAGGAWKWLLGAAAAGLVVVVLWQQERINALFAPAVAPAIAPQAAPPDVAAPEVVPEPTPAIPDPNEIPIPPLSPAPDDAPRVPDIEPAEAEAPEPGAADLPQLTEPQAAAPGPSDPASEGIRPPADVAPAEPVASPAPGGDERPPADQDQSATDPAVEEAPPAPAQSPVATPTAAPEPSAQPAAPAASAAPLPPGEPASVEPAPDEMAVPADPQLAWLRSRQGDHYTLQLIGARDRGAINAYVARHGLTGKYAVFTRDLKGKPWYSLVYGDYPDRDAALRGRDALPDSLRGARVWPRTFASVWDQLPADQRPR